MISIIVPIYNVGEYVEQCIQSLLCQIYKDIEIILVNDGSTDNSEEICKKYEALDDRILYIRKENGGASSARNKGIDIANGDYIAFVDGDDFVEKTMYDNLFKTMQRYNADIVACGRYIYSENSSEVAYTTHGEMYFDGPEALGRIFRGDKLDDAVWDKLFKKEIFSEIRFPVGEINEDSAIIAQLFNKAARVAHTGTVEYYYRQRLGSVTNSGYSVEKSRMIEGHLLDMEQFVIQHYPSLVKDFRKYYAKSNFSNLLYAIKSQNLNEEQQREKERRLKKFDEYFWSYVFNSSNNTKNRLIACLIRIR